MNYDIFLFKGHGRSRNGSYDTGATNGTYIEAELVSRIVDQTMIYLKDTNLKVHVAENNFLDKHTNGNTYNFKYGLSLHINAGGGTGTEIIVPINEKYLKPDFKLCEAISDILNIPNRGIKSRDYYSEKFISRVDGSKLEGKDYYGEIREAWNNKTSLSILELCFIDNSDINKLVNKIDEISLILANYIASICSVNLPNEKTYTISINNLKLKDEADRLVKELSCRGYNVTLK